MAVPSNPTLSQVCSTFGQAVTTALSRFLRGAGIVPNTGPNSAVPTSLPISLSQLAGATTLQLSLSATVGRRMLEDPDGTGAHWVTISPATATANPSGGSGGYTYSWSFTSNPYNCTITNPTSQTCSVDSRADTDPIPATLQCVMTDAAGDSIVAAIGVSLN